MSLFTPDGNRNGRPLACGIVGCGYIADVYMEAFRGLPAARVAAACDTNAKRLAEFCDQYQIQRSFPSIEGLLDSNSTAFVVIATPPFTHYALCRAAIDRGVPVLVEKPVCLSLAETQELASRAARNGVPVAVMQNYRFKAPVLKARRLLESGVLGDLHRVDCVYHGGAPLEQKEQWRQKERRHRLLLYEWAEHFLDIEVAFAGPVREIRAVHVTQKPEAESTLAVHALVEHCSGIVGSIDLQLFAGAESVRVELHGSRKRAVMKFYPEGLAVYKGLVTPFHELLAESQRVAAFAWNLTREKLRSGNVTRRAVSHRRYLERYLEFLRGEASGLPLSIDESLQTAAFLDRLAAAAY